MSKTNILQGVGGSIFVFIIILFRAEHHVKLGRPMALFWVEGIFMIPL